VLAFELVMTRGSAEWLLEAGATNSTIFIIFNNMSFAAHFAHSYVSHRVAAGAAR
jgi:hypothetical protein